MHCSSITSGDAAHALDPDHPAQENVDMMSQYIDLKAFQAIYVVDLCHSLCEVAKKKVAAKGWKNVHVVEADACAFAPPGGNATLVTFSYSLTSEWWWRGGVGRGGTVSVWVDDVQDQLRPMGIGRHQQQAPLPQRAQL